MDERVLPLYPWQVTDISMWLHQSPVMPILESHCMYHLATILVPLFTEPSRRLMTSKVARMCCSGLCIGGRGLHSGRSTGA